MNTCKIARAIGDDWRGAYGLCPGPGHSSRNRRMKFADRLDSGNSVLPLAGDDRRRYSYHLRAFQLLPESPSTSGPAAYQEPVSEPTTKERTTLALSWHRFWSRCQPIVADCPVGRYLNGRSCALPPSDGDLRWHPHAIHWPSGVRLPAMVGLVSDAVTEKPLSLHLTFVTPDGSGKADVVPPRLVLPDHSTRGVCRLWADHEVESGLAVAEGIETALAVARGFTPVWATLSADNLRAFPYLGGIEALTIVADGDEAGQQAATECAERWHMAGCEVRLRRRGGS